MTGGEEYLPPIVTKLKGDASDLLTAFGEADAAAKAFGKTMDKAGADTTKTTDKMSKDIDDFSRLVTKRMKAGETSMTTARRESDRLKESIARMRAAIGKGGDDETLFRNIRQAQNDFRKLSGIIDTLTPELDGVKTAMAGVGRAAASTPVGLLLFAVALAGLIGPATAVVAALADLVGFAVLIPPAVAVLLAAVVPLAFAFQNFGDAVSALASGDLDKINEALKKLSPSARSVAKEIGKVLPELRSIQKAAQEGFFQPLKGDIKLLVSSLLPTLRRGFMNVGSALGEIVDKMIVFISQPAQVAMLNRLFESTTRILRGFMDVGPAVFGGLGKAVDALLPSFEKISAWIARAAENFGLWLGKAAETGKLQRWLDQAIATLGELWGLTKAVGSLLRTIFAGLDDSGRSFIGSLTEMVKKWDEWLKSAEGQEALKQTAEQVKALGSAIVDFVGYLIWLESTGKKIMDFFKSIPGAIGGFFSGLWGKIEQVGSAVGDWFAGIGEWFSGLPAKISAWLAPLPGKIQGFFTDAAHRAVYAVGWMAGQVIRFFMELPGKTAALVSSLWTWVTTKFSEGVDKTVAFVRELPGKVSAWMSRTKDSAVAWAGRAVDGVIAWFKGLPGRAVTEMKALRDRVTGFFKGAKSWLSEAGKDLVRGLIDGVRGMWNWAIDKVKSFASDIVSGFKDALGVHSPSVLFAEAGEFSAIGYMQGWMKRIGGIKDMWADTVTAPVVSMTSGGAAASLTAPGAGGRYSGPSTVSTTLEIDGREFARAVTPAVQRTGIRGGATGFTATPQPGYAVAR